MKNGDERLVVLNSVARSIIEKQRGISKEWGFPYNGTAMHRMNDSAWKKARVRVPVSLQFSTIPFEGLTEQVITLRLSVITSGSQPVLKLRWVGEEVQREDIAQEFKAVLQVKIGEAAVLSLGAFDPK